MKKVTVEDLAEILGVNCSEFSRDYLNEFQKYDIEYSVLDGKDREDAILRQLKKIDADTQLVGGDDRIPVWENGWNENLHEFIQSGYKLDSLKPKYFHPDIPYRFKKNFVVSSCPGFDFCVENLLKRFVFEKYFSDSRIQNIYEFGCGTGVNLVELARMFPEKNLFGTDFVQPPLEIINCLRKHYGYRVEGSIFDMRNPDQSYCLKENSAVLTYTSMEQLYDQIDHFIQYLLGQHPRICVHMEPVIEFYDENNLVDWTAMALHKKRHYLVGLYPKLLQLQQEGVIDILAARRLELGNDNHESTSLLVWHPKK